MRMYLCGLLGLLIESGLVDPNQNYNYQEWCEKEDCKIKGRDSYIFDIFDNI